MFAQLDDPIQGYLTIVFFLKELQVGRSLLFG